ncbi:hypothetical protein [Schleiferilactobacillus harbinensis]|uniref:hypothetical protein n=1 Tax=Schleiferilactobacillus harbinensis TaxID=304207 RepID=UPI00116B7D88|nr:hypothetical protein [Schleiferilactobacillus harbinensis]GEK06428.1 hypothetical protein LHA01_16670 [Schleiferilactobacillus harbinensis]
MSRSYKHFPCVKDFNRGMKAATNRRLRRKLKRGVFDEVMVGKSNAYRRLFESWDISDYAFRSSAPESLRPTREIYRWVTFYRLTAADFAESVNWDQHKEYEWRPVRVPVSYRETDRVPADWHPRQASARAWRREHNTWRYVRNYLRK